MPFRPDPFLEKFERLRTLRRRRVAGYTFAAASVAAASAVRAGAPELLSGIPFAPYFIAVALTAAVGGGRVGVLAIALSAVAANYLGTGSIMPAAADEWVAAGLFVVVAGMILALIWLLNHAIDRMWNQAESARLVLEFQPAGVVGVDAAGKITMVNSAVERQLGYLREELLDRSVDQLIPENLREQHAQHRASYLDHPVPRMMGAGRDLSALAKDGSMLPVEVGLNPVTHDGRVGALATIVDISERKKLEQRTQILANEVSHRAHNLLAVVRALALRKLPSESATEFVSTLDALARTQDVFGRKTVAPLRSILEAELAGFGAQTSISGCDVKLTPSAGQDFSLICHELATNAAKYGALSTRAGSIKVAGKAVSEDLFELLWAEEGGPEIAASPAQTSFGLKMLHQLARGMNADLEIEFLPQGLRFKLLVPLDRITNVHDIQVASRA